MLCWARRPQAVASAARRAAAAASVKARPVLMESLRQR
jgi:hypothetical protein